VVDVEVMRAARRQFPVHDAVEIGRRATSTIEGSRMHRKTRSAAASVTHQRGRPGKSIVRWLLLFRS